MALKSLLKKPVKGDINEYIDFGSLKKKPKQYNIDQNQKSPDRKAPSVDSWLLRGVKNCIKKNEAHQSILESKSRSINNLNRYSALIKPVPFL